MTDRAPARAGTAGWVSRVLVVLAAVGLALVGLASGVAAVLVHAAGWWGLLLGLATTAALVVFLGVRRWARAAFAVGWVTAIGVAMLPRDEGDYLVAATLEGYLLLATVPVWVVAGLYSLLGRARAPRVARDPG